MNIPNPDLAAVAAHAGHAPDEGVVMVNLIEFGAVHQTLTEKSIGSFVSSLREETIVRSRFIVTAELPTT